MQKNEVRQSRRQKMTNCYETVKQLILLFTAPIDHLEILRNDCEVKKQSMERAYVL